MCSKPAVATKAVRAPFRSSSAFVATVVPCVNRSTLRSNRVRRGQHRLLLPPRRRHLRSPQLPVREQHRVREGPAHIDAQHVHARLRRMSLPDSAKELIESGASGHLVTLNEDGSPQVTCIWVGVEGDELVSGHLPANQRKLQNVRRDPRVTPLVRRDSRPSAGPQGVPRRARAGAARGRRSRRASAATRARLPRPRREVPAHGRSAAGTRDAHHRRADRRRRPLEFRVKVEAKLEELGLVLPPATTPPPGVRLPFAFARVSGQRVYISGHGPQAQDGTLRSAARQGRRRGVGRRGLPGREADGARRSSGPSSASSATSTA